MILEQRIQYYVHEQKKVFSEQKLGKIHEIINQQENIEPNLTDKTETENNTQ